MSNVPEGFTPLSRSSPFLDLVGPCYARQDLQGGLVIGLRLEEKHCNVRGTAHGGLLVTLADVALGYSVAFGREPPLPVVTANLSVDFAGSAQVGDWVEVHTDIQRVGRRLAFANAYLVVDGQRIVRASAVFSVVSDREGAA